MALPLKTQAAHANPVKGTSAEEQHHPTTSGFISALFQAAQGLAALGIPVEWHLSHGVGHGIDAEGLRQGGEFLGRRFGLRS